MARAERRLTLWPPSTPFAWLRYVWSASAAGAGEMKDEAESVSAFVTGFGALPNCQLSLENGETMAKGKQ